MTNDELSSLILKDMMMEFNNVGWVGDAQNREPSSHGKWVVDVKGNYKGSWEISVVRSDNHHGMRSYGWFDKDKLLISHNGGPCRWPILPFVFDKQIDLAHQLCDLINSGKITNDQIEKIMDKG